MESRNELIFNGGHENDTSATNPVDSSNQANVKVDLEIILLGPKRRRSGNVKARNVRPLSSRRDLNGSPKSVTLDELVPPDAKSLRDGSLIAESGLPDEAGLDGANPGEEAKPYDKSESSVSPAKSSDGGLLERLEKRYLKSAPGEDNSHIDYMDYF